jgi:putative membrane protein
MAEQASKRVPGPPPEKRAVEYLANERTFLAWVRTSVAVISLGFLVARFSIWLRQLGIRITRRFALGSTGASVAMGESMMAFGAALAVLAAWRYHVVNRNIEAGVVSADRWLIVLVTVLLVALSLGMAVYVATASGA